MIHRVTLDTNCIIDLEQNAPRAGAVRDLIRRHECGELVLSVPTIAASERQREGTYYDTIEQFDQRLAIVGLERMPRLLPMLYLDVCFFDHCLWADDAMESLEYKIHCSLHPQIEYEYADYCARVGLDPNVEPTAKEWRNRKCDVQVLWTHIYHHGDLLVTSDENFLKATKLPRLLELGAGAIVRPQEAAAWLAPAV